MKFFGGNKKKQAAATPKESAPPPPQPQIIKIVGDSKHVVTTTYDAQGNPRREVAIAKLTPEERAEYGVERSNPNPNSSSTTPKKKKTTKKPKKKKPPPAASSSSSEQQQQQRQPQEAPPPKSQPKPPPAETAPPSPQAQPEASVENLHPGDVSLATIEVTRELVKQFIADIWNRGEIGLIPEVCHPSLRFNGHVGMDRVGHDGFARMVTTVREALTDYHCEIHSMVVETNKAFCRLRFTGKHTGNLLGYPPTGKSVAWMGASEFTCKNGKILKVWELGDVKSLEEQLRSME